MHFNRSAPVCRRLFAPQSGGHSSLPISENQVRAIPLDDTNAARSSCAVRLPILIPRPAMRGQSGPACSTMDSLNACCPPEMPDAGRLSPATAGETTQDRSTVVAKGRSITLDGSGPTSRKKSCSISFAHQFWLYCPRGPCSDPDPGRVPLKHITSLIPNRNSE